MFGKKTNRHITRILVVEDEPLVAFDTEHFLNGEGFEIVATVDSVSEAVAVLEGGREVDLVLADVNLSDGSGIEVAQAAHRQGVEVLFATGNCPSEAREIAAGCLSKPYAQRDLSAAIAAIEAVLDGRKPRRLPQSFSLFRQLA